MNFQNARIKVRVFGHVFLVAIFNPLVNWVKEPNNDMLEFSETHIRPEGFQLPSWNEFVTKANDSAMMD